MDLVSLGALCAVLLLVAGAFACLICCQREKHIRRVRMMNCERMEAEAHVRELRGQAAQRRTRVEALRNELEAMHAAAQAKRREQDAIMSAAPTPLDILKDIGLLDDAGVHKAVKYLKKTGSVMSVESALVVLGIVSPEDMNGAVRSAAAGVARGQA